MAKANKIYRGAEHKNFRPALERFAEKCRFDPLTGCILWTGGTSAGRGNTARYGRFWDTGTMWFAHRWSGVHIHGLHLGEHQAGHTCPHGPNTLCVQHVAPQTQLENLKEQNARMKAKVQQSSADRQFWLLVSLGIEPAPPGQEIDPFAVPFYDPPEWFQPFMPKLEASDDCPF